MGYGSRTRAPRESPIPAHPNVPLLRANYGLCWMVFGGLLKGSCGVLEGIWDSMLGIVIMLLGTDLLFTWTLRVLIKGL